MSVTFHRAVRAAATAAALTVVLTACAATTEPQPQAESTWDPEAFLAEDSRRGAELLGIEDPPDVERIRFVTPLESDEVLLGCLQEAGQDVALAPGGGIQFPTEQPEELRASADLAIYTCWEQYPTDPKYRTPETEERLKWMYHYRSTTMLECFAAHGYPYEGTRSSEQAYIDSEGEWNPYADLPSHDAYVLLSEKCPQTPPEYWEQSFW